MINKLIDFSIRNKFIIGLFTIALIGVGLYSMSTINLGSVPDITNNQVQVITVSENLSTEDIEQFVTYPVELAMANLPGVREIRSVSRFGLSVVTVVFEDDMGTYLPRQLVQTKLSEIEIPEKFGKPSMGPITTGLGEIYQYTIEVKPGYESKYNLKELRSVQDWIISRQMAMVPGVVEVNAYGGKIKQYEVALDPGKLNSMNISISEVFEALESNNANTGGAYIEKNHMANFIRGKGLVKSLEDIRNIVVKTVNGTPVLIKDIADTVHFDSQVRYGAFTQDGHEAVGGVVLMLKGANPNAVTQNVEDRMKQIEKSLPVGLEIVPFLEQSDLIARTTSTVTKNLVEGALIVLFVLVLLLGSFRGGLITASVIPLALLFAFICMRIFDVSANLMSLGAIDFGIIVDGAVIIVEGTVLLVHKKMKIGGLQKFNQQKMDEITYDASSTMMNSAFFGQIIILIVFTPILFLTGVAGKMFQPMAYTFGFAVLGAIILCLTYVPMVSSLALKPRMGKTNWFNKFEDKVEQLSNWIMSGIHRGYHPIINRSLNNKIVVVAIAVLLFVGAGFAFSRMGGVFIPSLDEGDIAMQALIRPGSSLTESIETSKKIENILLEKFPEVKTVIAKIGVADIPTDPMPMDIADMYIILEKNKDKWVSADTKEELIAKIKEELSVLPGINYVFSQPIELRFNELMTGVRADVAVKLFGENLEVLSKKGQKMAEIIQTVPGAADVSLERTSGLPQMTVDFDRGKIAQYGLSIEKLNRYIRTAFAGGKAGVVFEGERRYNLVVRLSDENRKSIESLRNLYIDLPNEQQIPLKEVAKISFQPGPMQISRDNTSRRITIGVNVRGRDVESMVEEIQQKLSAQLELPPGYHIEYGGSFENLQRAKKRLLVVVPIALLLIFILLYFALKSVSQAVMIYVAVPLAAIGGVFALALRGMPFSISAGVGFIVLFGVAVLNGLILISRFNSLKEEGTTDLKQRIFMGTKERLRPILLTAAAAIMGFAPMALSSSAGAEVQRPLATVVISGLFSATLLTLIVIPVLYYLVESRSGKGTTKIPANLILLLIVLGTGMFFIPQYASGQLQAIELDKLPQISIHEAVERAKANYPKIKTAKLQIESRKALKKTAWNLGTTNLFTGKEEVGNGNAGIYTVIGIKQNNIDIFGSISESKLRKKQVVLAEKRLALDLLEMERVVRLDWYNAYVTKGKFLLYRQLDSVFTEFAKASKIQYEEEAISKLEYLAAANQARQVTLKKRQLYRDYRAALQELNSWLVKDTLFTVQPVPVEDIAKPILALSDSIKAHPLLAVARQEIAVAGAKYHLARSEFLPTLSTEYGFQRIAGQGGYHSFQIGIGIPLFFMSELGHSQSAEIQKKIAIQRLRQTRLKLQSAYNKLIQEYKKWWFSWQYYRDEALPLAQQQRIGALTAYSAGAINYVTFIQNISEAIEVEIGAWDALDNYMKAKSRLIFFLQSSNQ